MADAAQQAAAPSTQGRRNILIAMDGSEHAEHALDWYVNYVHKEHDHLIVIYVPELVHLLHSSGTKAAMVGPEVLSALVHQEMEQVQVELNKLGDKLKERHVGGEVKYVEAKKPGEGILKAAEDHNAQLIIMGSRGRGTIRRTILGSVSDFVVHHSHIPVAICKHPHHHHHHHKHQH